MLNWEYIEDCCPVCGEPMDYCQGHGEIGDPMGYKILRQHDYGDHSECHSSALCAIVYR